MFFLPKIRRKMRSMSSSYFGNLVRMLALALTLVIIFSIVSTRLFVKPPPAVEVTDCSLTSETVNSGGQTSLTFTLKSNDDKNAHLVKVEFSSHYLVNFFLGSEKLPKEDDVWYYEEMLNPLATHTQLINIRPTLESGISKLTYRITVVFYIEGKQFFNKNLDLTVQLP